MLDGLFQPPRKPLGPPVLEIQDQVTRKPTASFERPSSSNRADYGFLWPFSWGKYMGTCWFTIEFGGPRTPDFKAKWFQFRYLLLLMICLVLIWSKRRPFWARPWQPYIVCYWGLGKLMSPGNRRNQCFAAGFMGGKPRSSRSTIWEKWQLGIVETSWPSRTAPSFTKFHQVSLEKLWVKLWVAPPKTHFLC